MKSFAMKLRQIRISSCMTQKAFCERLGFCLPTYKAWEIGKSLPTLEHYEQLVSCFDLLNITYDLRRELKKAYQEERGTQWLTR